jgi:hypothetical protein
MVSAVRMEKIMHFGGSGHGVHINSHTLQLILVIASRRGKSYTKMYNNTCRLVVMDFISFK